MASTVWKGQLAFGLVSIPVRLVRAARRERVRMHYVAAVERPPVPVRVPMRGRAFEQSAEESVDETAAEAFEAEERRPRAMAAEEAPPTVTRTRQVVVGTDDEEPVMRRELLRAHEVEPDRYVTFTSQEMRALRMETSSEMQIVRSVRLEEIDPVYFETSYYVMADKGGERAYALLFRALKDAGYVAVATVAMHGREHVVVIRPGEKGLLAHTMFYANEVHAENEFDARDFETGAKELQLASTFVKAIAGPFAPEEFSDRHRDKLEEAIASKVAEERVSDARVGSQVVAQPAGARENKTIDIMDALRKSIVQSTSAVPKREPGKATRTQRGARKKA